MSPAPFEFLAPAPGWYPHPKGEYRKSGYELYYDGQNFTDNWGQWVLEDGNPGYQRLCCDGQWTDQRRLWQSENERYLLYSQSSRPALGDWSVRDKKLSLGEAGAKVDYPNLIPVAIKQKGWTANAVDKSAIWGLVLTALVDLGCLALWVATGATIALVMFLIVLLLLGFIAFRGPLRFIFDRRRRNRESFLASPGEALGLPDDVECIITGTVVAGGPSTNYYDYPSIVWLALWRESSNYGGRITAAGPVVEIGQSFFLEDKSGARVIVDGASLTTSRLCYPGDVEQDSRAWVVQEGDEVSISGRLISLPDGSRVITGKEIFLSYPMPAYGIDPINGLERNVSANDVQQIDSSTRPGPGVLVVGNGFTALEGPDGKLSEPISPISL